MSNLDMEEDAAVLRLVDLEPWAWGRDAGVRIIEWLEWRPEDRLGWRHVAPLSLSAFAATMMETLNSMQHGGDGRGGRCRWIIPAAAEVLRGRLCEYPG